MGITSPFFTERALLKDSEGKRIQSLKKVPPLRTEAFPPSPNFSFFYAGEDYLHTTQIQRSESTGMNEKYEKTSIMSPSLL